MAWEKIGCSRVMVTWSTTCKIRERRIPKTAKPVIFVKGLSFLYFLSQLSHNCKISCCVIFLGGFFQLTKLFSVPCSGTCICTSLFLLWRGRLVSHTLSCTHPLSLSLSRSLPLFLALWMNSLRFFSTHARTTRNATFCVQHMCWLAWTCVFVCVCVWLREVGMWKERKIERERERLTGVCNYHMPIWFHSLKTQFNVGQKSKYSLLNSTSLNALSSGWSKLKFV